MAQVVEKIVKLQIPSAMAYGEGDLVFRVHLETLVEAPYAHTAMFDGPAPTEIEVTTISEGTGPGAVTGNQLEAHVAVIVHSSNQLIQSTWTEGVPGALVVEEDIMLPGLAESVIGLQAGEIRQIVIPVDIAYPFGPPTDIVLGPNDAFVFILEAIEVGPLG